MVLHNFAEFPVVTVVILTHILQKYSLKQSRMQIIYFQVGRKLEVENRRDKVPII